MSIKELESKAQELKELPEIAKRYSKQSTVKRLVIV